MPMQQAVLTGDLIKSSLWSRTDLEAAFATLAAAAGDIGNWQNAPTHFTRYRGDGWQMVLEKPPLAIRAALYLTASLGATGEHFATRIALASGATDPTDSDNPASAFGPAFVAAGRALDQMGAKQRLVHANGGAIAAATTLSDHIAQSWTVAQCRAVALSLVPVKQTHAEMAKVIGITRQAFEKALAGAGFGAIENALTDLEATDD